MKSNVELKKKKKFGDGVRDGCKQTLNPVRGELRQAAYTSSRTFK